MGATVTNPKVQVAFAYLIADTYVSVVANLYPGATAQIRDRVPTESDTDAHCEIVSAAYQWNGKAFAWDDIPQFIEADIEREAWDVYHKKFNT